MESIVDTPLIKLCVGEYAQLSLYFGPSMTLKDITDFDLSELLECVKIEDRLRMASFFKKVLRPKVTLATCVQLPSANKEQLNAFPRNPVRYLKEGNLLDLHGQLMSSCFPQYNREALLVNLLRAQLTARTHEDNILPSILFLDLSRNGLQDEDMPYVYDTIVCLPNLQRINLKDNRIYGKSDEHKALVDDNMRKMLALPNIVYVDITGNPLATTDRVDFFTNSNADELKKLIWIPQSWVPSDSVWNIMVNKDVNLANTVKTCHWAYYHQ